MGSSKNTELNKNLKEHWNNAYSSKPVEKLGWYETDLSPMLKLIKLTKLTKDARIINIGSGSTTLIDQLLNLEYTNLIATDISEVALNNLTERVGEQNIQSIVDDLTKPQKINTISPVDLWIDRAVLHFFTDLKEQKTYFDLLSKTIKPNGYTILAQFNTQSAKFCSGLPVFQYDKDKLSKKLGDDFSLMEAFNYTYTMPSGDTREYVYTLFKKK